MSCVLLAGLYSNILRSLYVLRGCWTGTIDYFECGFVFGEACMQKGLLLCVRKMMQRNVYDITQHLMGNIYTTIIEYALDKTYFGTVCKLKTLKIINFDFVRMWNIFRIFPLYRLLYPLALMKEKNDNRQWTVFFLNNCVVRTNKRSIFHEISTV